MAELAKKYEVSQVMISRWKGELLKNAGAAFGQQAKSNEDIERENQMLYAKIGKLEVMSWISNSSIPGRYLQLTWRREPPCGLLHLPRQVHF